MDLSHVPELSPGLADQLRDAGVPHAEALSIWEDVTGLAERVAVSIEHVESLRDAARAAVERKLAEVGMGGLAELANAELPPLADKTGIELPYLEHYQRKARDALGKVVLSETAPIARVHVGEATHHEIPILTAGMYDEDDAVLARAEGNAVLLKPRQEVVPASINGVTHRALPLYKERRAEDGALEEVRVRIVEIREVSHEEAAAKPEEKKKGGIGRLFSKKKQ